MKIVIVYLLNKFNNRGDKKINNKKFLKNNDIEVSQIKIIKILNKIQTMKILYLKINFKLIKN